MAKRFIDTGFFDDSWISELSVNAKIFFIYLITNCDHAGIIDFNKRLAEFKTGFKCSDTLMKQFNNKLVHIRDNYYFIPSFINFQYSKGLSSDCKPHKAIIDRLKHFGLFNEENQTVSKQLSNSLITVLDKDKDKDKDKDSIKVRDIISFCFDSWNDLAHIKPHLSPKRKLNAATKKKMRSRIKEHNETSEWADLFHKIEDSPVLGVLDGMSWFTFDWIFHSPDRYDKIMAGWVDFKADGKQADDNGYSKRQINKDLTQQAIAMNPKE